MLSVALFSLLLFPLHALADSIPVTIPSAPSSNHAVQPNFLGISFELSYMNEYFGDDTSTIPSSFINYLTAMKKRTGAQPVRIRVGGNSMDNSVYVASQTTPMLQLIQGAAAPDDEPVDFGPVVWDVLGKVASSVGGATYLIGLSLRDPTGTNALALAGGAAETLGDSLDGFLLGNEPDLYYSRGDRPNLQNYTTTDYMREFNTTANTLTNTSAGNVLAKHDLVGPTICCAWNFDALLDDGYMSNFQQMLKYVSLQHYPQNNCNVGKYLYGIEYYVQHANAVTLAQWQASGISKLQASKPQQPLILTEFNSAACGGIPTISDTFAVGSLWTIDYALQLASVGYSAAYLHTRERGISYNLFTPPQGPNGGPGAWATNPPFYSLLVTAEALRSKNSGNGVTVADLNVSGSKTKLTAGVSGYAVYDASDKTVQQLVFFNFANVSAGSGSGSAAAFAVPAGTFAQGEGKTVTVKYLTAQSMQEHDQIAWGGETYFGGAGDGKLVAAPGNVSWAPGNAQMDCSSGCTISVPAPGMAVVFAGDQATSNAPSASSSGSGNAGTNQTTSKNVSGAAGSSLSLSGQSILWKIVVAGVLCFVTTGLGWVL